MDDLFIKKDETVVRDFARFGLNVMDIQNQDVDMVNAKAGIEALQHLVKWILQMKNLMN